MARIIRVLAPRARPEYLEWVLAEVLREQVGLVRRIRGLAVLEAGVIIQVVVVLLVSMLNSLSNLLPPRIFILLRLVELVVLVAGTWVVMVEVGL